MSDPKPDLTWPTIENAEQYTDRILKRFDATENVGLRNEIVSAIQEAIKFDRSKRHDD